MRRLRITFAVPLHASILAAILLVAGCGTPTPNNLVRLEISGAERYGLATEDGIVALNGDDLQIGEVPIEYWYKGSPILDDATIDHRTENLALLHAKSTRLQYATFGAEAAQPDEDLYIQVIEDDPEHRPVMIDCHLFWDGEYGDLLEVDEWFRWTSHVARDFRGAGVYAKRKGVYELVGLITGDVASNPHPWFLFRMFGPYRLLPFVSIDNIAPVLPQSSDFFKRRIRAFRPDFEYGLTREGKEPRSVNDKSKKNE